jgi:hypothetical protein
VRFKNKNTFFYILRSFEKSFILLVQRWRCSCKFRSRRIGFRTIGFVAGFHSISLISNAFYIHMYIGHKVDINELWHVQSKVSPSFLGAQILLSIFYLIGGKLAQKNWPWTNCYLSRVSRLGEFSPIGWLLVYFEYLFVNHKSIQNIWAVFLPPLKSYVIILTKTCLGYILGDF